MENNQEEFKQAALPIKTDNNLSRLGISFGPRCEEPKENAKSSIQISLQLSKEESEKQLVYLTKSIKNKLDPNYAMICEFTVLPDNQYEFLKTLENIYSPNHQLTELNLALSELIAGQQLVVDHFLDKDTNKVYLIFKLGGPYEEIAVSQIKLFSFLGLEKIIKEAKNSLEINLSSKNNMKAVLEIIKSKNVNLFSALLQQISLELIFRSSPTIMQDLLLILENMGVQGFIQPFNKDLNLSVFNIFIKKLRSFDIDLQFESTDKLDEVFRKNFLESLVKFNKISIDKGDEKNYKSLMKTVEGEFTIYFTISEMCALTANVKVPDFLDLFNFYEVGV